MYEYTSQMRHESTPAISSLSNYDWKWDRIVPLCFQLDSFVPQIPRCKMSISKHIFYIREPCLSVLDSWPNKENVKQSRNVSQAAARILVTVFKPVSQNETAVPLNE